MKLLIAIGALLLAMLCAPVIALAQAPPPVAASDVRVVADGLGGWRAYWRDNSWDETRFDALLTLVDVPAVTIAVGSVAPNITSIALPRSLPVSTAAPAGCHPARLYIYSVRLRTPSLLPAAAELPLCSEGARITFPTAGQSPILRRQADVSVTAPVVAAALGLVAATLVLITALRHPTEHLTLSFGHPSPRRGEGLIGESLEEAAALERPTLR